MIKGAIASLITPFKSDGSLDRGTLTRLANKMVASGFDVVCFAGGTGEFLSLQPGEREDGLRSVIEGSNGKPVLASALFADQRDVLASAERFAKIGAAAMMVMPSYFYVQSQDAMFEHLSFIGKEAALPVVLFNSVGRSGRVMTPETILRLADSSSNIVGVKETTANLEDIERLVTGSSADFQVLQAHEPLFLPSFAFGASGSFGSLGNIIPKTIVKLHRTLEQGDFAMGRKVSHEISKIAEIAYSTTIPVGIKYIANALGVTHSAVRPPLSLSLDAVTSARLSSVVAEIERLEAA